MNLLPPVNQILSDHNLITFDFSLSEYMPLIQNSFSRCLPDSAVAKFKEIIPITFVTTPSTLAWTLGVPVLFSPEL